MRISTLEIAESIYGKRGKKITAAEISRVLRKDPAYLGRIKNQKQGCPALLAAEIDEAVRAIADFKGLSPDEIIGWRLIDLRPDVVEMVLRAVLHDLNSLPQIQDSALEMHLKAISENSLKDILDHLRHGKNGCKGG
ncbi:MAG: hypothetical protein ACYDIC_12875 [Desulfobaccales bacterium]